MSQINGLQVEKSRKSNKFTGSEARASVCERAPKEAARIRPSPTHLGFTRGGILKCASRLKPTCGSSALRAERLRMTETGLSSRAAIFFGYSADAPMDQILSSGNT